MEKSKLKETENDKVVPYFVESTDDEDFGVRKVAVRALGELQAVDNLDSIEKCLSDEDWGVRLAAIQALGDLATDEAIKLIKALEWCGSEKNAFTLRNFSTIKKLYANYGDEITTLNNLVATCVSGNVFYGWTDGYLNYSVVPYTTKDTSENNLFGLWSAVAMFELNGGLYGLSSSAIVS